MNIQQYYYDNFIDAKNEFTGGGGGNSEISGGGGTTLSDYLYITSNSNLYLNNPITDGEIRIKVKNNDNNPNYSQDHRVRITKDGKLQVYHVYNPFTPNYPSGWYDISDEIVGVKFNSDLQQIEITALSGTVAVIQGQITDIYATLTTILTALGNVNNGLTGTQKLLYDNDVLNKDFFDLVENRTTNYDNLMEHFVGSGQANSVRQRALETRATIANSVATATGIYGTGLQFGVPIVAGLIGSFYALQEDRNIYNASSNISNVNFEITPSQRRQLLQSNLITSVSNMINLTSNLSNMSLEQGFINSNITDTQLVPSLKSNKVLLGNITTPNASYQMEGTGDINFNEYYRNSTSLTTLLGQKQDNMSATQPIFITTANIGLNYDSSLTKVGNNLSVVKTATTPLAWTGNNIALSYDSTLTKVGNNLSVASATASKWTTSGTNIYNNNIGNVGINDTDPQTRLSVQGDTYISGITTLGLARLNFISSYTNSTLTLATGTSEYYLQYTGNGTLVLSEPIACDLLVVGAGGNGGTGAFSGGGGAGEVIYYPNFPLRNGTLTINVGTSSTTASNRISSITHSTGTQIIAKGGGNGAFVNNQSLFNLFQNKKPWGMYFAENWSGTNLPDSSGNGRHATTAGTITKTTASGNGASGAITYISGGTSSTISFPTGSIPSNFTILGLTRYTGGARARIIHSRGGGNWLHGHWNAKRGMAFYEGWKTNQTSIGTLDDWLCCIGKNDPRATGFSSNILLDGSPYAIATGGTGNYNLGVNFDYEQSDWALSCVMIWNQHLTDAEMVLLNNMVNQYKTDGVYMLNVINSITSATSGGSGGGGIVGTSSAGASAGVKFDEYKSFAQAGLNGSSTLGGNGGSGSSLYNTRFTTTITGSSLSVGLGGTGVGATPASPITKTNYGDGGDGNGGVGYQGIIIIRFKVDTNYLQVKSIKDNANSGLILNANESPDSYQLRLYPWSDTFQLTGVATRGWSFRCHDKNTHLDLLNLFSSFGGRIGIKTKNPTAVLDVNGDIACKTFNIIGSELYGITCQIVNQDATGEANITLSAGSGGNYGVLSLVYIPPDNLGYISCSKSLKIKTGNDALNSYIYIDNTSGKVGIGITNPSSKLELVGDINSTSMTASTGNFNSVSTYGIALNNGNISGVNKLTSVEVQTGQIKGTSLDLDGGNITNGGFFYGMAQQARFLNMSTGEWHYDTQSRNRFYFTNDGTSSHTVFRTGSTSHYFQDKDATDYCILDRFGISTYFEVISGGAYDNIGCPDAVSSGVYVYRRMFVRLSTFTEIHRCFCEDELYDNYDDFINEYVGRIVVSKGKIKTALKEAGEDWRILEGKDGITIDDSHPVVELSRKKKDKAVVGVITKRETRDYPNRLVINSLGEGACWLVNTNGNFEAGDFIQTSDELGYGERQDDDINHNYTLGKVMIDCSFELDNPNYKCEIINEEKDLRRAFIPCFYYSG